MLEVIITYGKCSHWRCMFWPIFHLPEGGQDKLPKQVGALYNEHNNTVQLAGNKFSFIRVLQGKCATSNVLIISNTVKPA